MEFRYRAGEEREPAVGGYFADQAFRAGLDIGSSGLLRRQAMSRTEALLEELRRERMRDELLVREIAQKRILEEEIVRELEIERRMLEGSFNEESFSLLPLAAMEDKGRFGPLRRNREIGEYERSPSLHNGDIVVDTDKDRAFESRPPVVKRSMIGKKGLSKLLSKSEISATSKANNKLPEHQESGVKRKAANELPLPKKEWCCSLCHVTATSQKNLNAHFKGKMHKAKEALFTNNTTTSKEDSSSSVLKHAGVPLDEATGDVKKQYKQSKTVWCDLCIVKCNTQAMLDAHLKGKRHKSLLRSMTGDGSGTDTTEVVKEIIDQNVEEEEVKSADNTQAIGQKVKEDKVK